MDFDGKINQIFSMPIYISRVDVSSIKDEYLHGSMKGRNRNLPNSITTSKDENILDDERYSELKIQIQKHMEHLYYDVFQFSKKTSPYISASWLVLSNPNNVSKPHSHANSIFSGVVYLKAPKKSGNINFINPNHFLGIFHPEVENENEFNSREFSIEPEKGMIIIFPSFIKHQILKNLTNQPRVSLAFNFFLRGDFVAPAASLRIN